MKRAKKHYCEYCGSRNEQYYSVESAAKLCDCSQQFFRNKIRDREITFVKIGSMVRIPAKEFDRIIVEYPSLDEQYNCAIDKD